MRKAWQALAQALALCGSLGLALPAMAEAFTMEQALQEALSSNRAILGAEANVSGQQALVRGRYGAYLPQLAANASWGVKSPDSTNSSGQRDKSTHPQSQALTLKQPLTFAEETANLQASRATRDASLAQMAATIQNTLLSVVQAYTGVLVQQAAVQATEALIEALKNEQAAAKIRFKNGEATKTELDQASARLSQAQAQAATARGQLAVQLQNLQALVGKGASVSASLVWPNLPQVPSGTLTVANHPQLLVAMAQARASRANAWGAASGALPELSAQANAQRSQEFQNRGNQPIDERSLTLQVSMPLFSGGQILSNWQASRAQARANAYAAEDTEAQLVSNLTAAQSLAQAAAFSRQSAEEGLKAQTAATKGVRLERKGGTRSQTELLDSEQALAQSKLAFAQSRQAELTAAYQLLAAAGQLTALPAIKP